MVAPFSKCTRPVLRQGQADDVQPVASEQFAVVAVVMRHPEFTRHLAGAIAVDIGDGDHFGGGKIAVVLQVVAAVLATTDDANFEFFQGCQSSASSSTGS